MATYILHNPQIVDITIKGKLTECIIANAQDSLDPYQNVFFVSYDETIIEGLRPYISNNRIIDMPYELRTISGYTIASYKFGGEYVKRYNDYNFNASCMVANINGISYIDAFQTPETGVWYIDKNLPLVTFPDNLEPVKYKVISFLCKYDIKEKKYAEGYEPEVIGEIIKNMFFIKYDPQLHPVVKRKHYKKD